MTKKPEVVIFVSSGNAEHLKMNVQVPEAEYRVLRILANLGEAHGPGIARASNGSVSVAAVYKLLSRLEQRGLVQKREEHIPIGDITARRMFYKVHRAVTKDSERGLLYEEVAGKGARRNSNSGMHPISVAPTPI